MQHLLKKRWMYRALLSRVSNQSSLAYLQLSYYGAVEPLSGEHFFYEFSHLDSVCFQQFIDLFAAAFPDSFNLLHLFPC
ncbi:MAG: hypothetical protein N4J56_004174 [Chroococcidiopsis sp. SAG 2025]|uniref:hypothetical protein n=1 Tax=Chroococcidiopsis sp. SAG 2025 TaxID=171389 RepID=UPI00293703A1|nr:hypothetical protein [Chroococcidiopsis sp. SAG 2025]MDV2994520.1 hypothetical protein [Chroococcidiopsis sp. SAG 2025]